MFLQVLELFGILLRINLIVYSVFEHQLRLFDPPPVENKLLLLLLFLQALLKFICCYNQICVNMLILMLYVGTLKVSLFLYL